MVDGQVEEVKVEPVLGNDYAQGTPLNFLK